MNIDWEFFIERPCFIAVSKASYSTRGCTSIYAFQRVRTQRTERLGTVYFGCFVRWHDCSHR